MFVFACGSGSEKTPERPSVSPPEEVPTPPATFKYSAGVVLKTNALYNAEEIEVYYSEYAYEGSLFTTHLSSCVLDGLIKGYDQYKIGLLSGIGIKEGFTKDFLLNPDVERTFADSDGDVVDSRTINYEFDHPLSTNTKSCRVNGNEATCKRFMCGVETGD